MFVLTPSPGWSSSIGRCFKRGGVEDDLRPSLDEQRLDPGAVADVEEDETWRVEESSTLDGQLQRVQRGLVAVEHDQLGRLEAVNLSTELGADRATGAGDEHPPAGEVARRRREIGADLPPSEKVLQGELANVRGLRRALDHLAQRRQHLHGQARLGREVGQLTMEGVRSRADRDEQGVGSEAFARRCHVLAVAHHGNSHDRQVTLRGVVVQQCHGQVRALRIAEHGRDDLLGRVTRSEDQQPGASLATRPAARAREQGALA